MKHLSIASEWINALVRAFTNTGLNVDDFTRGLPGFNSGNFVLGQRMELGDARKMWHQAVACSQDPLLGLKIGLSQDYRAIGVLAPVIWHSPSVAVALENLARFQLLISENGAYSMSDAVDLDTGAALLQCEYIPAFNVEPVNPQQVLAVISGTIGVIAGISNGGVRPLSLLVPPALNAELLAKHLACRVMHGEGNFVIRFPKQGLSDPLAGCDAHLYEINKHYAEDLLCAKNAGLALIDAVKTEIAKLGFCSASIEDLEAALNIHRRTLQRNLAEQGTSFRKVKEQVLKQQAVSLLRARKLDIHTVSEALGYSEPSAFHRSFKTWFGMTPAQLVR